MKLYDFQPAPSPRRVRVFLAEKGVTIETEQVDLSAGATKSAEFRQINPAAALPVLELDDGTCIAETMAICRYIEELHPEPALFGRDPVQRAQVEMWSRRIELSLFLQVASAFRHTSPLMAKLEVPQIEAWGEANRGKIAATLKWLDKLIGERQFVAGDDISVADITLLVATDFMRIVGQRLDDTTPNLLRWYQHMIKRPSYGA